jgi:hypothetical protein
MPPGPRDILDEDAAAVTANVDFFGPWVATAGFQQVALSTSAFPNFTGQVSIQESRDGVTVLCDYGIPSGSLANRVLVPGSAFVRVRLQFPSPGTVAYSLRGA